MLRTLALAVLLIVTALPVSAGFKEGLAAYNRGDYRTAFREFKALAEQGDARSQRNLGFMYENGRGVPKNYKLAVNWRHALRSRVEHRSALVKFVTTDALSEKGDLTGLARSPISSRKNDAVLENTTFTYLRPILLACGLERRIRTCGTFLIFLNSAGLPYFK